MFNEKMVLCGANAYDKKYYLNEQFSNLPEQIKQELQIMCVLFTEEVGGILVLEYDEDGCGLKIRQMQMEKRDLLESLEMYYKVFVLGEEI